MCSSFRHRERGGIDSFLYIKDDDSNVHPVISYLNTSWSYSSQIDLTVRFSLPVFHQDGKSNGERLHYFGLHAGVVVSIMAYENLLNSFS